MLNLSEADVRRLHLRAQGLYGSRRPPAGKRGALAVVERLGQVQIDTISVVERAHHHTIWTRHPGYLPDMLEALQSGDRLVFEYWTHAASVLPMRDFRFSIPRMRAIERSPRTRTWLSKNRKVADEVLSRIREEGPLGSADFEDPRARRGSWWDWKPAKRALEVLFGAGKLMVAERRKFQRLYDLTERVLPDSVDTREPDASELGRFLVRQSLKTQGVAPPGEIGWHRGHRAAVESGIEDLVASGEVLVCEVAGLEGEPHYALAEGLDGRAPRVRPRQEVHILSPFDNAVIQRVRLKRLFGFDFRLECYMPAEKRTHGYFCLPILWGDRFIGRLDAKADRKEKVLVVKALLLERGVKDHDEVIPQLGEKLRAFAGFNGCEEIVVEDVRPRKLLGRVRRET